MNIAALRGFRPSRIGLRLLAFNVLVLFVPVLGILYLDVYEAHLRQAQENAMAQQAMILAAAIGEPDAAVLDSARVTHLFDLLGNRTDARLRVYDVHGALVGDSARGSGSAPRDRDKYEQDSANARARPLYRLGATIANAATATLDMLQRWTRKTPSTPTHADADVVVRDELQSALAGRYGAATRATPGQRSLTLYSAVPVRSGGAVLGAVVASQSTYRILRALYDVRLRVFEIVLASLLVAALLTAASAATIVGPLWRLERQATRLTAKRGRAPATFPGANRKDEIGALARALEELTRRTNDHITLLQSFSGDVSHELKNPLASIRTAAETMVMADSTEERERFFALMTHDIARLERLVSSLREIAIVEEQIAHDATEAVDVAGVLDDVAGRAMARTGRRVDVHRGRAAGSPLLVRASRERLTQVFDNLIDNAASFAPADSAVDVTVVSDGAAGRVTVEDRGPGIPPDHLDRIFLRFFSYRPGERRADHVGLGLAIARQIAESYGGTITASNRDGGGARFDVRFPRASS